MPKVRPQTKVFIAGGGDVSAASRQLARDLGREFGSDKDYCVITGTAGLEDPDFRQSNAVKDLVVQEVHRREGYWIGVERGDREDEASPYDGGKGRVLRPGGNRWRNYEEARLCDAAIVLEGGAGSLSEAVFCLALGKPVIFVGPTWKELWDTLNKGGQPAKDKLSELATEVYNYVNRDGGNPRISEASLKKRLLHQLADGLLARTRYYPAAGKNDAANIVQIVQSLL